MKFEGNGNDVSDGITLEKGLYIIAYQYKAADDFPIFTIEIENIAEDGEKVDFSDSQNDGKKGTVYKGKQKTRLQGGKYVVGVSANGVSSWSIELTQPEKYCNTTFDYIFHSNFIYTFRLPPNYK